MRRLSVFLSMLFVCLFIPVSLLHAQVQAQNGSIQGNITDPNGGLIPGAAVQANEVATGTLHSATTDSDGHFSFPSLQPGAYEIKINKQGFATILQKNLALTVGRTITLKLTLLIASANDTVVVNSAPLIDQISA